MDEESKTVALSAKVRAGRCNARYGRLLYHPSEDAFWNWAFKDVLRLTRDWRQEPMARELTFSEGQMYTHETSCYYDTALKAPTLLRSGFNGPLALAAWDGERFAERALINSIETTGSDAFCFDETRGVLVHFAGTADTSGAKQDARLARGGLTVRECGSDGVWRDVPGTWPELGKSNGGARITAGWDGSRKRIVVIDGKETRAWDGASFKPLGAFPHMSWKNDAWARTASGDLAYIHMLRDNKKEALLWTLSGGEWRRVATEGLVGFRDLVFDEAEERLLIFGADFGSRREAHMFYEVHDDGLRPVGPLTPTVAGAVLGPRPWLFGRGTLYALDDGGDVQARARLGDDAQLDIVVDTGSSMAGVLSDGKVIHGDGDAWSAPSPSPPEWRREAAVAKGNESCTLMMFSGSSNGRLVRETWRLTLDRTWEKVKTKGASPSLSGALAAWHPAAEVWVVTGGTTSKGRSNGVWEMSTKGQWVAFAEPSPAPPWPRALFADPDTGRLLCVDADSQLWSYETQGTWRTLGVLEGLGGMYTYDESTRCVWRYSPTEVHSFALGPLLDSLGQVDEVSPQIGEVPKAAATATPKPEAIPPSVWLRLTDEESDKYWFASRAGAAWTARWGRRSLKVNSREQTYRFETEEKAAADYAKKIRAKVAKGYAHAEAGEAVAQISHRMASAVAMSKRIGKGVRNRLGGMPPGVSAGEWPCCANCKHPMQFIAWAASDASLLPLGRHAGVAVFACNGEYTGGACASWEPHGGCNRALLRTETDVGGPVLDEPPTLDGQAPCAPLGFRPHSEKRVADISPSEDEAPDPLDGTKFGGYPLWIQGDDTPRCRSCDKPMRLAAQFEEFDPAMNFGGGVGYAFVCEEEHEATFLWQQ